MIENLFYIYTLWKFFRRSSLEIRLGKDYYPEKILIRKRIQWYSNPIFASAFIKYLELFKTCFSISARPNSLKNFIDELKA
jgi:hypothetical protein